MVQNLNGTSDVMTGTINFVRKLKSESDDLSDCLLIYQPRRSLESRSLGKSYSNLI